MADQPALIGDTTGRDYPAYQATWRIAPRFLLRMTGFPVDLMASCRFPATAAAIRRAEDLAGVAEQAQDLFARELVESMANLRAVAATAKFREAMFLSNPSSYPHIERWIDRPGAPNKKFRQRLLTIIMYLQRFCMKNDTTSFFGPSFWGSVRPEMADSVRYTYDAPPKARRTLFFSHWCAETIAQWMQQFPQTERIIRPRRVPTVRLEADRVRGFRPEISGWAKIEATAALPPLAWQLWSLVDGERTLAELIDEAGRRFGLTEADSQALLQALVDADLVHAHIEIPVGLSRPLDYLEALAAPVEIPPVQQTIAQFQSWRMQFVAASWPEKQRLFGDLARRFESLTQRKATRGAGQHYAARTLFHEDATRNFAELAIGGSLLADMQRLGPIWDLICIPYAHEYRQVQEIMVEWFRHRFPQQETISFVDYALAFIDDTPALRRRLHAVVQSVQALSESIFGRLAPPDAARQPVVHHTLAEVLTIVQEYEPPLGAILNPDILIAAASLEALNAGRRHIVIGEVHASVDLTTHSPFSYFLSQADEEMLAAFVAQRYAEAVAPDELAANLVRLHSRKTSIHLSILPVDVEGAGRSPKARSRVTTLADLEVRLVEGRLRLYSPRWERFLRLTSMRLPNGGDKEMSPLRPFSLPEQEGGLRLPARSRYCPRIQVDDVILHRRSWRIDYGDWPYELGMTHSGWDFNLFVHMLALQRRLDLPDQVFVKLEREPKPIFVDFDNYFLLYNFYKRWRGGPGAAVVSEAYPNAETAWLSDDEGRYLCELRMGWYRSRGR